MNDDDQEKVLEFSGDPGRALISNSAILRESLECSICNSLMLDPYTIQCGHTFCGNCLLLWIKERHEQSTCPQCRSNILSEPVLSLSLRQLALAVAHSWNASQTPKFSAEDLAPKETPLFFPDGPATYPVYDAEDDIYRCPQCSHEVDDGECTNCGRRFRPVAEDHDYTSGSENEDMSDGEDLNSFIDDDDEDAEESRPGPNFPHMLYRMNRAPVADEMEDDSLDEFVEEDSASGAGSDGSSDGSSGGSDDDSDGNDYSQGHHGSNEVDLRSDSDSDDSMLAETRARNRTVNDSDSDVEILDVRHRPMVIDDDDDSDE